MSDVTRILVVLALVLLNAIFVAAEYALVTARRARLEERAADGSRAGAHGAEDDGRAGPLHLDRPGRDHGRRDRARRDRRAARLALLRLPAPRCRLRDLLRRADVPQRRARRARAEGGGAAARGDARARARGADRLPLARLRADRLGAAALRERRPARARGEAGARRDDRLHARRHPSLGRRGGGRRRDPDGRGGDALQGLRLRREGGGRRDGAAARRRRPLGRPPAGAGAEARARVARTRATRSSASRSTTSSGSSTSARLVSALNDHTHRLGRDRGAPPPGVRRPGDEGPRRAPRRVPEDEPAHGDRGRRVRRDRRAS